MCVGTLKRELPGLGMVPSRRRNLYILKLATLYATEACHAPKGLYVQSRENMENPWRWGWRMPAFWRGLLIYSSLCHYILLQDVGICKTKGEHIEQHHIQPIQIPVIALVPAERGPGKAPVSLVVSRNNNSPKPEQHPCFSGFCFEIQHDKVLFQTSKSFCDC